MILAHSMNVVNGLAFPLATKVIVEISSHMFLAFPVSCSLLQTGSHPRSIKTERKVPKRAEEFRT